MNVSSLQHRRFCQGWPAILLSNLIVGACGAPAVIPSTVDGPGAELRALTGTRTRVVWVQEDGTDPLAFGQNLTLMGLDTHDGRGERAIRSERQSYVKPLLTPDGDRIVFSGRGASGARVFIIDWDGSNLRPLGDGFALAVWKHPLDASEWVYVGTDQEDPRLAAVSRFPIEAPEKRELVWNRTPVGLDTFQVSTDGRRAAGLFPWPEAGIAELPNGPLKKMGEGCWTALASARGPLLWYFDGAHRNVTMVDLDTDKRWGVSISQAPGFDGAEVFYPRWTNHARFLAVSGPYNQGGPNQVRSGGDQVEIHVGRFSADFTQVEAWARVTNNTRGDTYADVWIDRDGSPHLTSPDGQIGPAANRAGDGDRLAPLTAQSRAAGRLVVEVRLARPGLIPVPQSILPYRHALVVNDYAIVNVLEGTYSEKQLLVAEWAIRDGGVLGTARKETGAAYRLTVERYDAHPELEGERLIAENDAAGRPVYYAMSVQ